MRVVVFDLDHTLLVANSSFRFGLYLYRQQFFTFPTLLFSLLDYAKHKWGSLPMLKLHERSFDRIFKGRSLVEILPYVSHFLNQNLASLLYKPVVERLKQAQRQGDHVMILSSSPDFLVKEIAQHLKVEHWKATTYQTDHKKTFQNLSDVMEGEAKAEYIKHFIQRLKLSLAELTVYSDSYLDLPILKIAGEAIGVMPDSQLRKICLQNEWEIL